MSKHIDDWISRVNIPDVYPRRDDPYRPPAAHIPPGSPAGSYLDPSAIAAADVWAGWLTVPGTRPIVYQRALNFIVTANVTPVPITNGNMQVETLIFNIDSTVGNSAFFGFSSSITPTTGIEIRPGTPFPIVLSQDREFWELQRVVEAMAGMMAASLNIPGTLGPYRAPRVVFDASDFFITATVATTVRVMLFLTPEYQ